MKKRKALCMFAALVCFLALVAVPCHAMDSGFTLEELPEERRKNYMISLDLKPVDSPVENTGFYCFDVNEKGQYALGFQGLFIGNIVNIYDADGTFLYGFSFDSNGSFYLEWDGDNIILYLLRDYLAYAVDPNVTCVEVAKISDARENQEYWNGEIMSSEKEVNGVSYQAKPGLLSRHWKLVAEESDGMQTELFNESETLVKLIALGLLNVLFSCSVVLVIVFSIRKKFKHGEISNKA